MLMEVVIIARFPYFFVGAFIEAKMNSLHNAMIARYFPTFS